MIKIENLSKSYSGNPVIKGLSLHIQPGEFVFLQGESGSGKSTLLNFCIVIWKITRVKYGSMKNH
jgi:ABC-type multidrug transport system ATPase subunit